MAKKKTRKPPKQSGQQLTVRCSDADSELFAHAADIEGFGTVQQWLVTMARRRARLIVDAARSGRTLQLTDLVVSQPSLEQVPGT